MGQSVCTERDPADLRSILLVQASQESPRATAGALGSALLDGGAKHHVRAWKFEKNGRAVTDSPLCGNQGLLDVELQRTCSYLILHVYSLDALGAGQFAAGHADSGAVEALQKLAAGANAVCTPRGLAVEVVTQSEMGGCEGTDSHLRYEIFVWHGQSVEAHVKARAFAKAFDLDRLLRAGLLHQLGVSTCLVGHGATADAGIAAEAAEAVRRSGNRLLSSILDGLPKAAFAPSSLLSATSPSTSSGVQSSGPQRFPRLGLSVCRSLGVAPAADGRSHGPTHPPAAASAPAAQERVAPPALAIPPAAGEAVGGPAAAVPRLQLGGLGKRDEACSTPSRMDVDSIEGEPPGSGGRKRGRGPEMAWPPLRSTTNLGAESTLPKSARTDLSLPLPSPRGGPDDDSEPPMRRRGSDFEESQAQTPNSARNDAPAMLNLEEINMSEEELIRSYDPQNEENNYHLPHHLYKKLQLDQFRPVCSEVIKGSLFISSHQVAGDLECLRRHGITHIVNTAADACTNHFLGQFQYLTYYLKDANHEDISIVFYKTLQWIEEAVQKGSRVLVHCREGVSRSATIIIAYLMWKYSIPFETAHERIRRVRPICNPNTGFTCQLLVLGKRLGVGGGGNPQAPTSDRPTLFRVGPYHPNEPFLLLLPTECPQWPHAPTLDPRFGWVVQRGLEAVLWLGADVCDAEATQAAARQHVAWQLSFERLEMRFTVVQDGQEPLQFWQLFGLASPPPDRSKFAVRKANFDADAAILGIGGSPSPARAKPAHDLELVSARETEAPLPGPPSEWTIENEQPARRREPPSTGPPPSVPSLSLSGLHGSPLAAPPASVL